MNGTPVNLLPGTLPDGFCFQNWQQLYAQFIGITQAFLPGQYSTFNFGNTAPAPDDRNKPWFRTNNDGSPDKWYVFYNGVWASRHPLIAGSRIFAPDSINSESAAWSFDGGDGANPAITPITALTGAMWVVDTAFAARFPIGFGTLTSGKVLAVGDTGGEENHQLITSEIAAHVHPMKYTDLDISAPAISVPGKNYIPNGGNPDSGVGPDRVINNGTVTFYTEKAGGDGSTDGLAVPHNNMPPYRTVAILRRTVRQCYTV